MPNIKPNNATWPRSLDDMRREPGRIVVTGDLARLGLIKSYDAIKQLPEPLRRPGREKAWEARTILLWLNAPLVVPGIMPSSEPDNEPMPTATSD